MKFWRWFKKSFANLYLAPFQKPPQERDPSVYGAGKWLPDDLHHRTSIIHLPHEGMTVTTPHRINLGDRARDMVTGFEGIVTSRIEYLNGCVQVCIDGTDKEGAPKGYYFDTQQVEVTEKGAVTPIVDPAPALATGEPAPRRPGGPVRPAPSREARR